LVGETGCGKTTVARTILQLYRPTSGQVLFDGVDLASLQENDLRKMRRRMQMIFQDPYASLNPRLTVGAIIAAPLDVHTTMTQKEKRERVQELLELVGLNPDILSIVIRMNSRAVSGSALASRAPWRLTQTW
jgi:oligopeptide transport system ATP-binding protein